jgi:transposase InsO family protein
MKNDKILACAKLQNGLYELDSFESALLSVETDSCIHVWHNRLGHRDPKAIKLLEHQLDDFRIKPCDMKQVCESCIAAKMTRKPLPQQSESRSEEVLELIHTDVCGPMQTSTPRGNRYFMTLIDDYSKCSVLYLLKNKSEVTAKVKEYVKLVQTKFNRIPKIIRSDNGGEYVNEELKSFFRNEGIISQTTVPYTPQQNGRSERKTRYLVEMARSMLIDAVLPNKYWGEAVTTANYLQNLLPTRDRLKTPYEYWEGVKPKLTHTRRFGCVAYAVTPPEKRQKLDCKARKFTFVGYAEGTKGYRLLDTETDKITISRDVMFMEGDPHQLTRWNNSKPDDKQTVMNEEVDIYTDTHTVKANDTNADIQQQGQGAFNDSSETTEPRRSARSNKGVPPDRLTMLARNEIDTEPSSWDEMKMLSKDKQRNWIKAAEEEIKSLNQNNTWILCDLPEGKNAIDNKWVFKLKKNPGNQESQYKARLVAKGFTQKWGEDYNDTVAPVARYTTLRALLAVATSKKLQVSHYDVKTAFLNGDIDEELYMKQPEGFIKSGTEQKVCQLKKATYGLKQSAKNWNQRIDSILKENGFQQSKADVCLYTKIDNDGPTYILVYVDDLLICGNAEKVNKIAEILAQNFEIKNLGEVSLYLGIEIEKNSHGDYMLSQTEKIKQIISEFGLTDANGCNTPMLTDYLNIEGEENLLPSNEQYRQAVGALLYIVGFERYRYRVSNDTTVSWRDTAG